MRTPRIYTAQPLATGELVTLEAGPARHLNRALRMGPGDPLVLFNGDGNACPAELVDCGRQSATARILRVEAEDRESPLPIHLAIALSRGERMDWVIQKATELGVASIQPLFSERSEVKLAGDRLEKKKAHWHQVIVSACEQCGRNQLPALGGADRLQAWLERCDADLRLVLHHRAQPAPERPDTPADVALLIGPEGGLSPLEIDAATAAGFTALALGPRIMRTETAPLAAIAILQARWGDM